MKQQAIYTDKAPAAVGPYSQAVDTGSLIFVSGQLGLVPESGELLNSGPIEDEAKQVLANLEMILAAAGVGFGDVVKATIYLTNIDDSKVVNEVYSSCMTEPYPARECVGVQALPRGARVEISAVAVKPDVQQ